MYHKPTWSCFFFPPARWFPSTCARTSESSKTEQNSTHKEVFDIRQFLLDQRRQKELAEGIGIEEDDAEELGNKECWSEDQVGFASDYERGTYCFRAAIKSA